MKQHVKESIYRVKPYIPGKPIEEVQRELGLTDVVKLASNENPYGPSKKVLEAMATAAQEVNRYPDAGCHYLRHDLAKRLKVDPQQLIFGNGSDELIVLAIRALVNPGDEVVLAKPSFLIYSIASQIEGAVLKEIPLQNFCYDLSGMKAAITPQTKIIFLGNPDNPSGMYFTKVMMEDLLYNIPEEVLVFIDEAYFEYVEAKDYVDSLSLLARYSNVMITRTFSKMYGLAGLRIGYGIGHKDFIDVLNRLREPFNVNALAQVAARACLADKAHFKTVAKDVRAQRLYLQEGLTQLGLTWVPSHTNFILVEVLPSGKIMAEKLLHQGVIVRDMHFWGLTTFIRISIGASGENQKLIKALKATL